MAMFSSAERLWNNSEYLGWDERNESVDSPGQENGERNYYAMLYSLLIFAIVFGNVLVCLAVLRERSLQTTTNYLVVSLAVADLLVASLVMPWAVYLEVRRLASKMSELDMRQRADINSIKLWCQTEIDEKPLLE